MKILLVFYFLRACLGAYSEGLGVKLWKYSVAAYCHPKNIERWEVGDLKAEIELRNVRVIVNEPN